jgi:hypothetical protein
MKQHSKGNWDWAATATLADSIDDRRRDRDGHKGRLRRRAEGLLAWAILTAFVWWAIAEGIRR